MKRVLAAAIVSVLALLGFVGTASAISEEKFEECAVQFEDALLDYLADFDDVELEEFDYYWNDLWTDLRRGADRRP